MSTDHPVPPEIEAVLPDDAPLGHIAHQRVKSIFKNSTNLVMMNIKAPDGSKVAFQVTALPMGNNASEYALVRIARSCFVLLESGVSKEQALQFRADCYKKVASVNTQSKPQPEQKMKNGNLVPQSEASPQSGLGSAVDLKSASSADAEIGTATSGKSTSASAEVTDRARSPLEDMGEAPDGHDAWLKVRPRPKADGTPDFQFKFRNASGENISFQTTVMAAGGSEETAERIARLCYVKFSEGFEKAEVLAYRDELYSKLRGGGRSKVLIPQSKQLPQTVFGAGVDSKSAPASAEVTDSARSPVEDIGDAPDGHEAWSKLRPKTRHDGATIDWQFHFRTASGERIAFQATSMAAGGSEENAKRVARLCYVKFSEGCDKAGVLAYRDELYNKLRGGAPIKKRDAPESKQTSQKRSRMAGEQKAKRILIKGRAADLKNESINGVYALLSSLSGGRAAYRKEVRSEDPPRFLVYSVEKERWRICPSLETEKVSFAFLKASDGGSSLPFNTDGGESWQVFNGKDEGYSIDPDVRCLQFKGKRQRQESYSYSTCTSDSESSHDESSPAKATLAKAAPAETAPAKVPPADHRRVFAKMLVRSGLRCHCHFMYQKKCPDYMTSLPVPG